jgi:dihydroxy-acid dehydratase
MSKSITEQKALNTYSRHITQDPTQPASQAMLYAIGMRDEDFKKAQVGIASTGWEGNPCNMASRNQTCWA